MKARVVSLIVRVLRAWLRTLEPEPAPVDAVALMVPIDALLANARVLVQAQETRYPSRSGEAKRHQVYAELVKLFPDRTKRAIAVAIEAALA